jgi:hypothetical protein
MRYAALSTIGGAFYNDGIPAPMYALDHTYGCPCSCDEFVKRIKAQLSQSGLQTLQTFALNTARQARSDPRCPHHGWNDCDCQIVVLLVYGCLHEPVTLIVYGNDGETWLALSEDSLLHADPIICTSIEQALQL